jgi:predicted MFS family arabinose efflux permease
MARSTETTSWPGVFYGLCLACFAAYQQFKLPPVLPTLLEAYRYDRTLAGGFMSVYALMGLLLSMVFGRRVQRDGAARLILGAIVLTLAGNMATLAAPEHGWLVLCARALEGSGFAIFAITGPVLVTASASPRHLPILLGVIATWIPVGQLSATALAAGFGGWRALWWVAVGLGLALALWTCALSGPGGPLQAIAEPAGGGGSALQHRRGRLGLGLTALIFMLWSGQYFAFMTWLPQYLVEALGLDRGPAAAGYALPVVVLLVFNLATGAALKAGAPLGPLLMLGLTLQTAAWSLLPVAGGDWGGVALLVAYGMGAGVTPTCLFAMPAAILGARSGSGSAYGIVMTGRNLGVLVGPVLLPSVLAATGSWDSGHQAIAARLGDQDLGVGRVPLDLLAQPIDMSLQGVGVDTGVVAPDLVQEHAPRNHLVAAAIEILQDRGLLLGQAHLALGLRMDQHLGARPERVGADHEHRIVALLVLTQLRAQSRQQHAQLERFDHVIVGARVQTEDGVRIGARGGQHDDGRLHPVAAQQATDLTAVHVGQTDVQKDDIEVPVAGGLQAIAAGRRLDHIELFVQHELLSKRDPQGLVIVDQKHFLACLGFAHGDFGCTDPFSGCRDLCSST